jgi:hypothetical protein
MIPAFLLLAPAIAATGPVGIGQFGRWGAFRDEGRQVCYAVALPLGSEGSAAVIAPPGPPRLELRLGHPARPGTVTATIDGRRFALAGGERSEITRRAIVVALRNGGRLRVTARDDRGRSIAREYPLRGFASALDAATLACLSS